MKPLISIAGVLVVVIGAFFALNSYIYNEKQSDAPDTSMKNGPVTIHPVSHATMVLEWDSTVFYVDPIGGSAAFDGKPLPRIMLITDIHGDHLDEETVRAVLGDATLIAPQAVKDALPEDLKERVRVMANGDVLNAHGFRIEATPMYNLPESSDARHTKGRGNGYLIEKDGFRLYIAGDTAGTPEMRALKDIDVAFVPMNLPYTMSVEEAADAVLAFAPRTVYPYHYRTPEGFSDVEKFKELVNAGNADISVVLGAWYETTTAN